MSDFDMVGHRQVAFFMPVSPWPREGRARLRPAPTSLVQKNPSYCADLTHFY